MVELYLDVENMTNGEVSLKAAAVEASRLAAVNSKRILSVLVCMLYWQVVYPEKDSQQQGRLATS